VGVIVFGAACLVFLLGGVIYECVRDKDGEILTEYAHGRIAATALGSIVLWALSLFLVCTAAAVCIAPQFPGRSVYSVALDLAFNPLLYASEPKWTAPALAAAGVAFVPFLMAAIFGLPIFRDVYKSYNGDYCDDDVNAPEDESFWCLFAPFKRRFNRTASKDRAAAALVAASFAPPGTPAPPIQLPPQPQKYSSPGVVFDYCFTIWLLHFCGTCLYRMAAPISEDSVELWPWWTAFACSFLAMVIGSLALTHKLELMEIPSERARNERKQRWRSVRGFYSGSEFQQMLEEDFGFSELCDTTPSGKQVRAIEMTPVTHHKQVEEDKAAPVKEEEKPETKEEKPEEKKDGDENSNGSDSFVSGSSSSAESSSVSELSTNSNSKEGLDGSKKNFRRSRGQDSSCVTSEDDSDESEETEETESTSDSSSQS